MTHLSTKLPRNPADSPNSALLVSDNIEYFFVYLADGNPLHLTHANNILSAVSQFHLLNFIKAFNLAVLPIFLFGRFDN